MHALLYTIITYHTSPTLHPPPLNQLKLPTHSGDEQLRGGYSRVLQELLSQLGVRDAIQNVVDLGCATGLSSLELLRALPGSSVTGVDLSPHFLAVAQYEQQQRMVCCQADVWDGCVL